MLGVAFAAESINLAYKTHNHSFIGFFEPLSNGYTLLFILRSIVFWLLIIAKNLLSLSWIEMAVLSPNFLYLVIVILTKPYKGVLDTLGLLLC